MFWWALQLALWEEYADEVEEQMRVLLADNALLQAALADVRSSLSHERPNSAGASGAHPASLWKYRSHLRTMRFCSSCPSQQDCAYCQSAGV